MTTARKVIVVGGGLAGVTCAVTLAEAGVDVVLLEAAQRLGGRFATVGRWVFEHRVEPPGEHRVEPPGEHLVKQWDLPLEHGIHGVWRQYKNLRRLLLTYGLDGALLPAGDQSMLMTGLDGRPALVPIGDVVRESLAPDVFAQPMVLKDPTLREAALAFGPRALFQVALDLSHAVAFQGSRADISRYDHLSVKDLTSKWPPILRRLFSTLTHAAFFREAEDVSLAAFFSGLESYVLPRKGDSAFELFRLCSEAAVFGPLHQVIEGRGSKVRLCSAVSALTFDGDRALGVRLSSGEHLEADAVVVALDPVGFARLIGTERLGVTTPTSELGAPSLVVRWVYAKAAGLPANLPPSGVVADGAFDAWFWLDRVQADYGRFAAATGCSVIECHAYGRLASDADNEDDASVARRFAWTVEHAFPALTGRRVRAHVQRNAATHATFPKGTFAKLPPVQSAVDNVSMCGDWIAVPGSALYLERATLSGLLAARSQARNLNLDTALLPEPLQRDAPAASVFAARQVLRLARFGGMLPHLRPRSWSFPLRSAGRESCTADELAEERLQ